MGCPDGQDAVISGGAGSIGAATARLFVAEGARVVVTDIDEQGLAALAAELGDVAVNVKGVFLLARHALAAMRDGGSLIINSSVVGLTSDPGICAYATSKHALVGLMRTAAKEVADRGIRVNTLHPGPVDKRFQHTIEVTATGQDEAGAAAIFEEMIPLRRHAQADEIAQAALFLAGDEFTVLPGATVPGDGGMSV